MNYEYAFRGQAIGERKAQTQARVQVEEGGFVLRFAPKNPPQRAESMQPRDTSPSHLRLVPVRRQGERGELRDAVWAWLGIR